MAAMVLLGLGEARMVPLRFAVLLGPACVRGKWNHESNWNHG